MKKITTLFALLCMTHLVKAQINTFPHTEGFESPITTGYNVNFYPNWWANAMVADTIFQDDTRPYAGTYNLTMIPAEDEYETIIEADLDLTGTSNMALEIWAASDTNASGAKVSRLFVQTSLNGGLTWYPKVEMGTHGTFSNATTPYELYTFAFHPNFANQSNVKCRIFAKTGKHQGAPARVLLDEMTFYESPSDIFPPIALEPEIIDDQHIKVVFSEPVGPSAEVTTNYTFDNGMTVATATLTASLDTVDLVLASPLVHGLLYTLIIDSIQDLAGNYMDSAELEVLYNPTISGLVISEVMYDEPPVGQDDYLEFIELYNATCEPIQIGGMRIKSAVSSGPLPYHFIEPGDYYVIAKDHSQYLLAFGFPADYEWNGGNLDNEGDELIELLPAAHHSTDIIDSVRYYITAPWPTDAAGLGSSIEICNKLVDNSIGSNWEAPTTQAATYAGFPIYATPGAPCDPALNPTIDLGPDGNQCGVTSMQLDAGNPGSVYLWSTGETTQTITVTQSGIYTVVVNNGIGAVYDTINVSLVPAITATWNVIDTSVCAETLISFSDTTADAVSWIWDFGDNSYSIEQNPTHSYLNSGTYDVSLTVTNAFGCTDLVSTQLEINGCAGIKEMENFADISLFPNPTNGKFNLLVTLPSNSDLTVEILDINGSTMFSENLTNIIEYQHTFDSQRYDSGMYFVKIYSGENTIVRKLIVQ